MDTSNFVKVESILSNASAFAGDRTYSVIPKGFYISLISEAFREFNLDSFFSISRKDFDMPSETLTITLPDDCFNVKEIYVYSGDACTISNSKKVWWKKDYYTKGSGYFAKNKGNNGRDPYYMNSSLPNDDKSLIRVNDGGHVNSVLYYNIQMGKLMLSSSCISAGEKVHVVYNSVGGDVTEAPIIPSFCKTAIEDFVIEAALRFRMANEPSMIRNWQALHQMYYMKLNKEGMNGSWFSAVMRVRNLNDAQKNDLGNYYGKGSWAAGR